MTTTNTNCRAVASQVLTRLVDQRLSLPLAINTYNQAINISDQPLLQELCYGSCRYYYQLTAIVDQLLRKPLRAKDRDIYHLAIVGAYQLLHMRVPAHAAISETVAATRALKKDWAKGMINAILRGIQRQHASLSQNISAPAQAAMPDWLYQRILQLWPDQADDIFEAYRQTPPMTLRVNRRKIDRDNYLQLLSDVGIEARNCEMSIDGLQLAQAVVVQRLPNFEQGFSSVQDEAAQLAGLVLSEIPGNRILDACAAPGGKTCHLAEIDDSAIITAVDNDSDRLQRVAQNTTRLGLDVSVKCADAGAVDTWWDGQLFDKILLDAPCSATGVIRRNPDIKILRRVDDVATLPPLQLRLIKSLWQTLKPGGSLLYVTCSVLSEENDAVIEQALQEIPDAAVASLDVTWGLATQFGRQLLPSAKNTNSTDGFYYSYLRKQT